VLAWFFYDFPGILDEITALAVRGAGGPPRRDGGWDDLAAALADPGCGFEVVVCSSLGGLAGSLDELGRRAVLAARHGVTVMNADDLSEAFPLPAPPARRVAGGFAAGRAGPQG
jgi:hypothetical protein